MSPRSAVWLLLHRNCTPEDVLCSALWLFLLTINTVKYNEWLCVYFFWTWDNYGGPRFIRELELQRLVFPPAVQKYNNSNLDYCVSQLVTLQLAVDWMTCKGQALCQMDDGTIRFYSLFWVLVLQLTDPPLAPHVLPNSLVSNIKLTLHWKLPWHWSLTSKRPSRL